MDSNFCRRQCSGTRWVSRKGFTLVELMMVTLIIGLIVAIALPKFDRTQDKARFAQINGDLRNLGASQERYYHTHFRYALTMDELDFVPTEGVVIEVTAASETGWAAVATHRALSDGQGCSLYLGNATAPPLPNGQAHRAGPGVADCAQ